MLKAYSFLESWAGGYKLLAHSLGRHRHPQDSAVIGQTAYTYYFAQAMRKLSAMSYKPTASRTDPHPHVNFWTKSFKRNHRMTPVTLLGPLLTLAGYLLKALSTRLSAVMRPFRSIMRNAISHYEK